MQIMRLLVAGDIDIKTAGLLLYALQTASSNLSPHPLRSPHAPIVLDPPSRETPLGARTGTILIFPAKMKATKDEDDEKAKRNAELSSQIVVKNGHVELPGHVLKGFPTSVRIQAAREIESAIK